MKEQKTETKKESLERFELANKPTLIITKELKNKIDFLHKKAGATEWSGELITREEGTITDLNDWKIIAEDIYLADIGSPGFTGYEIDKGSFKSSDIIELYEQFPGLLEGTHKIHHLHSHHGMQAYFSGTDWENLEDRSLVSNYFLMLIVNFDGKWCAKVAFKAKKEGSRAAQLTFSNNSDGFSPLKLESANDKDVLVVMDCKIEVEENLLVDETFQQRYNKVVNDKAEEIKRKEEEKKKHYQSQNQYNKSLGKGKSWKDDWNSQPTFTPNGWYDNGDLGRGAFDNSTGYWEDGTYDSKYKKKDKKISELTEKEWNEQQSELHKFELRHAKGFINSILSGSYSPNDYTDVIKKLQEIEKEFTGFTDYNMFMNQFEDCMIDHFNVLFPDKTIDDYVSLLEITKEYLQPYRIQAQIIDDIVDDILISEIELNKIETVI
jgi:hypothetical protein